MVDQQRTLDSLYLAWINAEAEYAQALAPFNGDCAPATVIKDSALDLAQARSRADSARDRFFKRALR